MNKFVQLPRWLSLSLSLFLQCSRRQRTRGKIDGLIQPPPKFSSSYFLCSINIAPSSLCLVRSNHFLFIDSWLLSRLLLYWHYFCYMHALGKREFVCLFSQSELFVAAFLFLLSLRLLLPFHKSRPAIFLMYSIEGKEATRLRSLAVTAST